MITTVNRDLFVNGIRSVRPTNFTYEGLHALFDFFEELENGTGEQIEFDPIAICCEYTEYENILEACVEYGITDTEELFDSTSVIDVPFGGIIIQDF